MVKKKGAYMRKQKINRVLLLAALMAFVTACKKAPTPNQPNQPTDTVTQWRDWTIDWDWRNTPDLNLVKQYAADPSTRMIILNLLPDGCSTTFYPYVFSQARRNMENKCFSIYPGHIIGNGTIFVSRWGGAHLPNPNAEDINGMALIDSIGFTLLGFDIARGQPPASR